MAKIIISDDDIANESSHSIVTPQSFPQQYSSIPNINTIGNSKTKTNPFVLFTIVLLLLLVLILGAIVVVLCLSRGSNSPVVMPQAFQTPNKNDIYKENIKKIIQLDHQYFEPVDAFDPSSDIINNENLDRLAQLIFIYVQNAKRPINYDSLPPEFATAYTSYLNAWNQFGQEIASHPNMDTFSYFVDKFFNGFIHGFTGNINGIMEDLEKSSNDSEWSTRVQQRLSIIQSSWSDVEAAAGKYGINVNNVE